MREIETETKRYWRINGYDGTHLIYKRIIPLGLFSEKRIIALLQRLASRHLDCDEIVNSTCSKRNRAYTPLLEPNVEFTKRYIVSVGLDPRYVASAWTAEELNETDD